MMALPLLTSGHGPEKRLRFCIIWLIMAKTFTSGSFLKGVARMKKKLPSLCLALVLCLGVAVPVMPAEQKISVHGAS